MITSKIRLVKRFLLLVPGIVIAYFAYTDILPFFDRGVPWLVALLGTYVLVAYVLIPLALRLIRYFFRPTHIPLYSTTPDGFACDPVNIAVVGTQKQVIAAMKQAGWHQADKKTPRTLIRYIVSILLQQPYPTAPFSNLYLFGRHQDFGFQLPVDNNPRHRHHVRFWAASHTSDPRHLEHIGFWERIHKSDLVNERILWVGAASLDVGLGVIRHNAQVTHMIHPATDAERELIASDLQATGLVKKSRLVKIGEPYRLTNRVLTGYLHTDGKMKILEL